MQTTSMAPMVICSISCQARVSRGPSFRCRRNDPISMVRRDRPSGSFRSKPALNALGPPVSTGFDRSEEHTSELQSHLNLVCRLLLEKKKKRPGVVVTRLESGQLLLTYTD